MLAQNITKLMVSLRGESLIFFCPSFGLMLSLYIYAFMLHENQYLVFSFSFINVRYVLQTQASTWRTGVENINALMFLVDVLSHRKIDEVKLRMLNR